MPRRRVTPPLPSAIPGLPRPQRALLSRCCHPHSPLPSLARGEQAGEGSWVAPSRFARRDSRLWGSPGAAQGMSARAAAPAGGQGRWLDASPPESGAWRGRGGGWHLESQPELGRALGLGGRPPHCWRERPVQSLAVDLWRPLLGLRRPETGRDGLPFSALLALLHRDQGPPGGPPAPGLTSFLPRSEETQHPPPTHTLLAKLLPTGVSEHVRSAPAQPEWRPRRLPGARRVRWSQVGGPGCSRSPEAPSRFTKSVAGREALAGFRGPPRPSAGDLRRAAGALESSSSSPAPGRAGRRSRECQFRGRA